MKTSSNKLLTTFAAIASVWIASATGARANDWNAVTGWWNDPANWTGGVPDNTGGWAIGNIGNGGTGIITNTVPHVSEAWAGNGGVAGTIIVTNGGTLPVDNWLVVGRTGAGGNTPLSTLIVAGTGIINKTGDGFIVGDGTFCLGQVIVKDSAQVNVTGGWNGIGNGNGGEGWLTLQDNSVYTLVAQDWNIGDYGTGRGHAYIKDNATLNVSRFFVGKNENSIGALWQNGGAIVGTGNNANEWTIGGDNDTSMNAFGFYGLSGGTLTCPYNFQVGRRGTGILYQSGGTNTQSGWCDTARFSSGTGITWLSGGLLQHTGTGTRYFVGEMGRGEVTVSGSGILDTTANLVMGNAGSSVAFLNLNSGTVRVPGIDKNGGTAFLNLNGGTLRARANNPAFMVGNLNEAVVYSGNAIIDTAGFDVSVSQALLAPSGDGVQSIPITDGGAGYMAPPVVQIAASGVGSGATAVAQINPAAGTLTNIVVTCSGYGYGGAPAVTLIGGGPSTPATLGTPTLAAVSSGGLIKNGNGTLTLSGANTYTGATVVNAGKVIASTAATGNGSYSVASGAGFGVTLPTANAQLNSASLTLAASTLDIDLGAFGNPTLAPLNVIGALAVNGAITVNIADSLPQLGQFPLIKYGSRSGSGSFSLGTLPAGVVATIVTNAGGSIDLNVTFVAAPRWDGQAGGTWDIGLTTNWVELSSGLAAYYADGNPVLFNDSALGTTSVNLGVTVNPAKVTVNNSVLNYTLRGSGKISGATGLIKQGTGGLVLNNVNDYTGATRIEGGTVSVTNLANGSQASAIGSSSSAANNLVLANGTLSYSGPAVAIDRGYSVQATNSTIDAQSDLGLGGLVSATAGSSFVKTGPAKLTHYGAGVKELSGGGFPGYNVIAGTVLFNGTGGAQTNHSQNEFWVGSTINNGASLILSNTTLNVDSWFAVGRGNGTVGNLSTATLYDSKLRSGSASMGYDNNVFGNLAQQTLTLNGTSTFTNNGDMNLGESGGSFASVFLNGNSKLFSNGRAFVGWHASATGAVTIADSAYMGVNAWFSIGNEGGTGSVLVKNNGSLWVLWDLNITDVNTGDGSFTIQDNASAEANNVYVAKGAGSTGLLTQTGGSVRSRINNSEFHVGSHGVGTYNMSGGVVNSDGNWTSIGRYTDGVGVLNLSGGSFNHNDTGKILQVGEEGNGTLNVSGSGIVNAAGDRLQVASAATAVGVVNLDGGTIVARRIAGASGNSTFNFNGGLLRAAPNAHADFMSGLTAANVMASGAVIDTGTNNIGIVQPLLDGGTGGGLTKLGTGGLALMGVNMYTGPTVVSAGTLGGTGVISGPVTIASGAGLAPGTSIGTLTINNTLTLSAGSTTTMEIDKAAATDDAVMGLTTVTYGGTLVLKKIAGTLVPGDTFALFGATARLGSFASVVSETPGQIVTWDTSQLTVNGMVKVLTAVSVPVPISPVVSGGTLTLSWPANQIGWQLQAQTNSLAVGLSTNWVAVPGSTTTNQMTFPIDHTKGSVFFRLSFP